MSKKILRTCLTLSLIIVFQLVAQIGYGQGYDLTSSSGTFTALSGSNAIDDIEDDDEISTAIPIGFSFTYFGTTYTSLRVSSNGFVAFDPNASIPYSTNAISDGTILKALAPLWDDLGGSGGAASFLTTGTAGSRVLTIEWLNWRWYYSASAGISFQAKLYEGTNKIEFVYRQEAGALSNPSASIGLIGNTASAFYSLSNSSTSPQLDFNGVNTINTKPANGQTYTFTPNATVISAPSIAASAITASPLASLSATFSWINGNGSYRAVFVKPTSTNEFFSPVNGTRYPASSSFVESSNWYCVYNGTGNSVAVTNLKAGFTYRVQVVEYNGQSGLQQYNTTQVASNFTTPLSAPSGTASGLNPLRVTSSRSVTDLIEGDGYKRVVFVKAGTASVAAPVVNNTTYTASGVFGSGTQVGTTGWYCIFNNEASTELTVTGLTANTSYVMSVVDYNGPVGQEKYHASPAVPVSFSTFVSAPSLPTYTFTATSGTFTPLAGGTALDAIEDDDEFSASIPIGFTFRLGGTPFTQLVASSNGYITFNPFTSIASASSNRNNDLTYSNVRPLIAPFWDDLDGENGQASYSTSGVAPNRVFTIEYLNWKVYGGTVSLSFQVALYEATNKIEYTYRQEAGTLSSSASIGLALPDVNLGTYSFLSLNGTTTSPTMSSSFESSSINSRPATGQVYSFTPGKINQAITFSALDSKTVGDPNFSLTAVANSGLPITYVSSNAAVATVSGSTVTVVGAGTTTITASQIGDPGYNAAVSVAQPLVVKNNQTITFGTLTSKTMGDASFNLTAAASSALPVTYTSSNTAVATISGSAVTIVGAGSTNITASQPGDGSFNAAANVVQALVVNVGNQTITFNTIPTKTLGDAPFALSATSTSSLAVTFTTASDKITIASSQVTIVKAGSVTIKADQSGNSNYNAAASVEKTFCINPAKPTITLSGLDTEAPVLTASSTTGNQWYKEGVAISGSTGATFSPTAPGVYTVITTVDNCSSVVSEAQAIIITGMEDISKMITISPNPAQKEVSIDLTSLGKEVSADVVIFDLNGRVFHSSTGKGVMTVNIASYEKGNYLVRVKAGSRILTKQIAKN